MTTANQFAKASNTLSAMADEVTPVRIPGAVGTYEVAEMLLVYHLRQAARIAREIAEAKAARQGENLSQSAGGGQ